MTLSFQLFDDDNPLHKSENKYIFTTEGHVVPIDKRFREKQWNDLSPCEKVVTDQETSNGPFSNNSNVMTLWYINTYYYDAACRIKYSTLKYTVMNDVHFFMLNKLKHIWNMQG